MSLYEGMFLMDNRQANRDWDGCLEKLNAILTKHGAEVVRSVKWGERKLAYDINGHRRGTYVLIYFNAVGDAVSRIYREIELSELLHRAMILTVQKLPSEEEMFIPGDKHASRREPPPAHAKKTAKPAAKPETKAADVEEKAVKVEADASAGVPTDADAEPAEKKTASAEPEQQADAATTEPEPKSETETQDT